MKSSYYLFLLLILFACQKAADRRCIKSTGADTSITYTFNELLDTLFLHDDMIYEIIPSTENKVVVHGGENVISFIHVLANNRRLNISNENRCNFLRSFDRRIKVDIYTPDVRYIHYEGSEGIFSKDTIVNNSLRLRIRDGAGKMDLKVNVGYLECIVTHGWGDFELAGDAQLAYIVCQTNSFADTRKLTVHEGFSVLSITQGDMFVNGNTKHLKLEVRRNGNIFYTGTPVALEKINNGNGVMQNIP
jgi:hypothetical protein